VLRAAKNIEWKSEPLVVGWKRVKSQTTNLYAETARLPGRVGIFPADTETEKGIIVMMKTLQFMNEAIKDPKHPFRKTDSQPRKSQKSRYERRKIKEFLHLGDWSQGEELA
jgi:hypothetical protein